MLITSHASEAESAAAVQRLCQRFRLAHEAEYRNTSSTRLVLIEALCSKWAHPQSNRTEDITIGMCSITAIVA